ncbi:MrcB family domain-containing protein [Bacillus sp. N9]
MDSKVSKDNNFTLGTSPLARKYEDSIAAYISYSIESFPSEEELVADLKRCWIIMMNMLHYPKLKRMILLKRKMRKI